MDNLLKIELFSNLQSKLLVPSFRQITPLNNASNLSCPGVSILYSFDYLLSTHNTWLKLMEASRFDTNSSSEITRKFWSLQVKFAVEQEKHLGEYSSFFKPCTWNYFHLAGINLYRNDLYQNNFVSKWLVTKLTDFQKGRWYGVLVEHNQSKN